jgi:hypothetical protein
VISASNKSYNAVKIYSRFDAHEKCVGFLKSNSQYPKAVTTDEVSLDAGPFFDLEK